MSINTLRAYVRLDPHGNVIAGSLVKRQFKPKIGRWKEVPKSYCCTGVRLTYTPGNVVLASVLVTVTCNGTTVATATILGTNTTDITSLVSSLNSGAGYLGSFGVEAGNIVLNLNEDIQDGACPNGTLAFTVVLAT